MSENRIVNFINEKLAIAKLTNYDIQDEFDETPENPTIELRITKTQKDEIAVELWNATNNSMVSGGILICKSDELINKLLGKGRKTLLFECIIEVLGGDADVGFDSLPDAGNEIKNRLLRTGTEIYQMWSKNASISTMMTGMPDFDAKLPKKIPLFGFVMDEKTKTLTEGFWAMYNGEPELFVYLNQVNTELKTDLTEEITEKIEIKPFFFSGDYKFNTDIQAPPYTAEWLATPKIFKNIENPINTDIGKDIFAELYNIIIPNHLWMATEGEKKTLAYWIMASYLYDVFDAFPIGHGWGFYGSGKSRLGMFIVALAYHGTFGINITGSDLFRSKEEFKPTLVIDENEENLREVVTIKDDMINGSYVRGGGSVSRRREVKTTLGTVFVRDTFDLYSPTFFCSINPMRTPASRSRTITFPMLKKDVSVPITERRLYKNVIDALYEYRFKMWLEARNIYEKMNIEGIENVRGRDHELWLPIFVIMKMIGRWDEDVEDIYEFIEWNKQYKLDSDMVDEERPTLYAAIAKLWYEITVNKKGSTTDRKDMEEFWYRNPNTEDNWEFKVADLANVMTAIAQETGYKKAISEESVGRALSMLFLSKGQSPMTRKATVIISLNTFKNLVMDHMGVEIEDLGKREYNTKESLMKNVVKDWTKER